MSLETLWSQVSGVTLPTYPALPQMVIVDGQSLALGRNASLETDGPKLASYHARRAVRQLSGIQRSDNAACYIHGPLSLGYNAVAATGEIAAAPNTNAPVCLSFAQGVDLWRRNLGRPLHRMLVGYNAIAGTSILEFDDDSPTQTGTPSLGTIIRDNHSQWMAKGLALFPGMQPIAYGMVQGEADRSMTVAEYRAAATISYNDALDDIQAATGVRPRVVIWQTGGYTNTSQNLPEGPALAQLQLVQDFDAVFAGPLWPNLTFDNSIHPDLNAQLAHSEIAARVFVMRETGVNLNLLPGAPSVVGNQITIPFTGVEAGKSLAFDPVDRYAAYGGLTNHGCEVSGTTVTDVTLSGNAVTITAAAALSGRTVSIAMQVADMSGFAAANAPNYGAHRCDIMESAPVNSLMRPGQTLKRFIPSCRWAI